MAAALSLMVHRAFDASSAKHYLSTGRLFVIACVGRRPATESSALTRRLSRRGFTMDPIVFAGSANPGLAGEVVKRLGLAVGDVL